MSAFVAEIIGTAILILLGNGVVANVLLKNTKGHGTGLMAITWAWGIAVFVAVYIAGSSSGAHINPAVSIGLATAGKFPWADVPMYLLGQMIGAMLGMFLVYLHYKQHYDITENHDLKLATFSTAPQIREIIPNLFAEFLGTLVLVFGVLFLVSGEGLGSLDALPVGLLVLVIGLSLGGNTGYAINPARDLGPRIVHQVVSFKSGKRDSDWQYAWIPVVRTYTRGNCCRFALLLNSLVDLLDAEIYPQEIPLVILF